MMQCHGRQSYTRLGVWPSLRRGSSFTFLTPGPQWDFTLFREVVSFGKSPVKRTQANNRDPEGSRWPLQCCRNVYNPFTPCTHTPQKRKRREKDDADAVSLCSFDFKVRKPANQNWLCKARYSTTDLSKYTNQEVLLFISFPEVSLHDSKQH
ncbi:hypothetical protein PO909_028888 [Leuciscus waleckii]